MIVLRGYPCENQADVMIWFAYGKFRPIDFFYFNVMFKSYVCQIVKKKL